ncbi:MAG TPA: Bax inhibitor-1/YccA family protein, partial [Bacillota bacterium]|nr:Bax inhibitor-1/YccA family protein [Bacillota bacterium]
ITAPMIPFLWIGAAIVGLVLGLVNTFKREPSVPLILAYAAAQVFNVSVYGSVVPEEIVAPDILKQAVP